MNDEQNRKIVEDYMTAWSNADVPKLERLVADNARFPNPPPGVTPDKKGTIAMAQQYRAGFPDLKVRFTQWVVQGDHVAVRFVGSGTHKGTFMGIEPTNVRAETGGIAIVTVKDGKVVEDTTEFDALGLLTKIGAIPPLGEEEAQANPAGAGRPARPSRPQGTEQAHKVQGYKQN
jgi:predicted ester cyclase